MTDSARPPEARLNLAGGITVGAAAGSPSQPAPPAAVEPLARDSDVAIAHHLARCLEANHGPVVADEGQIWAYAGSTWKPIPAAELRQRVHAYDGTQPADARRDRSVLLNAARINSILTELSATLARPGFFADARVGLNCQNGFIALDDAGAATLHPHNPAHRARFAVPGRWTPGAYRGPPEGSLLARLLEGTFRGDVDGQQKAALLAEVFGVAVFGLATRLRQPKAAILLGLLAENGKSQVLDLGRCFCPPDAVSAISADRLADDRMVIGLAGKRLNATDELSSASAIGSDRFKTVITGEPVIGRDVYRSAVTFRPEAQHVFATNALPSFTGGVDRGVRRRLLVITFNRSIPAAEQIDQLGRRIAAEEPDLVLALLVDGAQRVIRQGGFSAVPSCTEALNHWLHLSDPVLAWVHDCVTLSDDQADPPVVRTRDAYRKFRAYAEAEGHRPQLIPSNNAFTQRLRSALPKVGYRRVGSGPEFVGLIIREVL
jgi:phage/plasmid-associated DNA primase